MRQSNAAMSLTMEDGHRVVGSDFVTPIIERIHATFPALGIMDLYAKLADPVCHMAPLPYNGIFLACGVRPRRKARFAVVYRSDWSGNILDAEIDLPKPRMRKTRGK